MSVWRACAALNNDKNSPKLSSKDLTICALVYVADPVASGEDMQGKATFPTWDVLAQ